MSNLIKKNGYNFSFNPTACESCAGNCCIGESGYIWINIVEIEALSKYLGLTLDSFREKYLFKVGYKYSIKEVELADIILYLKEFKFNLEALQFVHPNDSKDATLVMIYAKKNSKSLVKILNPLIVFDENNEFTKTVQNIYKEAQTHSIKVFCE